MVLMAFAISPLIIQLFKIGIYSNTLCIYIYITNILTESNQNQPISLVFKTQDYRSGMHAFIVGAVHGGGRGYR